MDDFENPRVRKLRRETKMEMDMTDQKENEETVEETQVPAKKRRGFASMDPELVRKVASMGGKAAHKNGTAHEFTVEEARAAGRKGGAARKK